MQPSVGQAKPSLRSLVAVRRHDLRSARRLAGRFGFTFTSKHGSWLNLIEGFFSKLACSVLRPIRIASKHELEQRILAAVDDLNTERQSNVCAIPPSVCR